MKKGIIFDMDGTLWDSAAGVAESWNEAILAYGYERKPLTAGDIQSVMGKTMEDIADILFPELKVMQRKELLDLCCRLENDYLRRHGGVLYPDIRKTMEKLKVNYHLYIVSNCQAGYIEAFLDYYKFHDLIEDIECYGNNDKPKGENIALLYQRNDLQDAVYVGDIQGDYDASMSAGVRFIHAGYGFGKVNADVPEIQKFSELIEVIDTVWN
jgi:phosphoglycolate phosphatase|uniref:HAD family hydrolase n=1 Tax=Agathobacter sp. TaxID=2021311 RepID=UPI0040276C56